MDKTSFFQNQCLHWLLAKAYIQFIWFTNKWNDCPAGIVGGGSECPALSTFNTTTEVPLSNPPTVPWALQYKWLPTAPGVCVCVCMGKCRARIQSMGHHTWLYVTSLSFTFQPNGLWLIWASLFVMSVTSFGCLCHLCAWIFIFTTQFRQKCKIQERG